MHGGFVEVSDDRVIDPLRRRRAARADRRRRAPRRAKARAEDALRANADDEEATAALARAEVRLEVAGATCRLRPVRRAGKVQFTPYERQQRIARRREG